MGYNALLNEKWLAKNDDKKKNICRPDSGSPAIKEGWSRNKKIGVGITGTNSDNCNSIYCGDSRQQGQNSRIIIVFTSASPV